MLSNLQKVQNNLYNNESINQFLKNHSIFQLIKLLNKTNKNETKSRIKQFFYKIIQSNRYKDFLQAGLDEGVQNKKEFIKYINSENSEEYFQLVVKKNNEVIALLDTSPSLIPMIFSLVYSNSFGIKIIKLFTDIYTKYSNHDCLYSEQIKKELLHGLQSQDTVVQMRFVEIIANIAIHGGKAFQFVKESLQKSLDLYKTQDILLKLNIVQIIEILGNGAQTSQLLRGHKIWSNVQKDVFDPNQQFYVKKSLLILLINMVTYEQYQMSPKLSKKIIQFLSECFKSSGQQLHGGLTISCQLLNSNEGAKVLIQNSSVFNQFLKLSRSPQDRIKNLFVENVIILTDKSNGKKSKPLILNILNCIGNPNLSSQLSQNMNIHNFMVQGIQSFCKWFIGLLQLPFEDLQLKLIALFSNLLQYNQICQLLFEEQGTTKYLLKPIGHSSSTKTLKQEKNKLVMKLIQKGNKQWKNTKLETYVTLIEKQLQKDKVNMEYIVDAD